MPKTHVNDALCVGVPDTLVYLPTRKLLVQSVGHGDRQMLRPADRHGNPRDQGYRDYCGMDRQRQGYTTCPGHRSREKRLCRVARVGVMLDGKQVSVKATGVTLLARNHGYRVSTQEDSD